ncbi:phosphatase PAP2 family protein [Bosea sp. BK604]|uniref:phosphatase PAP2 family protein n=1 Tax=Bosea sp. BK604 TaxID=2512180 RepID=UPI001050679C|nr:phosphatase PAP2 family protein [Bosea sp. BK604]
MRRWRVPIFEFDTAIARAIARRAAPEWERPLRLATLLADERLVLGLSVGAWLLTRPQSRHRRRAASHILLSALVTSALPHALKNVLAQERPDRLELGRKRHGVPKSGKALDSFPSGHAVHMGALAAAISRAWPERAGWVWTGGALISLTRIALLAHWASDVLAGAALGAGVECLLNSLTEARSDVPRQ